jgi:hypothetical protein
MPSAAIRGFLSGRKPIPSFADDDGAFHVAFRLDESVLAVHHSCTGLLPEVFYITGSDFHDYLNSTEK